MNEEVSRDMTGEADGKKDQCIPFLLQTILSVEVIRPIFATTLLITIVDVHQKVEL